MRVATLLFAVEPRLARLGRRARHPHGLHQARRRCASSLAGADAAAARQLPRLDDPDPLAMTQIPVRKFDAIVVGAGGSGMRAALELARADLKVAVLSQGLSDALAHRGRAGRHRRAARQLDRGQLALAHVRHGQGLRLPRRPGRDRVHVPPRDRGGGRARAHGHAVRPPRERQDLPAARSAATRRTTAARRWRCAPAPRPTAPATPCCTRSTSRTCAPTPSSSSSGWRST